MRGRAARLQTGGVEIYFGDRLVGSETSEMDPRGPLLNIAGPTRSSMRPARLGKQAFLLGLTARVCVCGSPCPIFLLVDLGVGWWSRQGLIPLGGLGGLPSRVQLHICDRPANPAATRPMQHTLVCATSNHVR